MAGSNASSDGDYIEHKRNYEGFITMLKWSTIGVVILLILMAIFLV
ncbi:aa3-type cytochrome c oxidase subunit IV [Nisaea sp.]